MASNPTEFSRLQALINEHVGPADPPHSSVSTQPHLRINNTPAPEPLTSAFSFVEQGFTSKASEPETIHTELPQPDELTPLAQVLGLSNGQELLRDVTTPRPSETTTLNAMRRNAVANTEQTSVPSALDYKTYQSSRLGAPERGHSARNRLLAGGSLAGIVVAVSIATLGALSPSKSSSSDQFPTKQSLRPNPATKLAQSSGHSENNSTPNADSNARHRDLTEESKRHIGKIIARHTNNGYKLHKAAKVIYSKPTKTVNHSESNTNSSFNGGAGLTTNKTPDFKQVDLAHKINPSKHSSESERVHKQIVATGGAKVTAKPTSKPVDGAAGL
jgi:hypothetical protein